MPVATCGIRITKDLDLSQYLEICQRDYPDLFHRLDTELVREGDFLASTSSCSSVLTSSCRLRPERLEAGRR